MIATREELLSQHQGLRGLIKDAVTEAERLRSGAPEAERSLALAISSLRRALVAHNAAEESLLYPVLATQDRAGVLRTQRMLEEHAAEHALFTSLLDRTLVVVAAQMHDLAEELDAHMLAEERTFLSPVVFDRGAMAP